MKRPGDTTPDPPGGRAAERLRLFEQARKPPSGKQPATPLISEGSGAPKTRGAKKRRARREKQDRRKA
jgi:hypothetical protein